MNPFLKWRILPFQVLNAFDNMAIDEAVLMGADSGCSPPTLRFYGWAPSAVSLGYFQNYETEVNSEACLALGIDIVRRPTGGKAVLHENELTYSVVASRDNPLFPDTILGTYKAISSCLAGALASMGIKASIAEDNPPQSRSDGLQSFCFSDPSRFELLVSGRKICGSAQVRVKNAFLQHGSLLLGFDPHKTARALFRNPAPNVEEALARSVTSMADFQDSASGIDIKEVLIESFRKELGIELFEENLSPEEEVNRANLLRGKYLTRSWNVTGHLNQPS